MQGSHLEQVVKVSRSTKPKGNLTEEQGPHSGTGEEEDLDEDIEDGGNEHEDVGEQDVDRLIDADSNEYVLSRSKGGVALTLDPLLIQVLKTAELYQSYACSPVAASVGALQSAFSEHIHMVKLASAL